MSGIERALCAAILLLVACIFILSSVPPVSRDALTHHLAVPKLYLAHGFCELPDIPFSYYPMNLDLLYMLPLSMGYDIPAKWIHFIFALLTAFLIFRYLSHRVNRVYGYLGALFFLSIPIVIKLSITVYVDLGLVFFSTAALLMLLKWRETSFKKKYLALSAISCGLALGTKYNALIGLMILTLLVPVLYLRGKSISTGEQVRSLSYAGAFFLIAMLVFSPWMIRNFVWKQNPLYPLFNHQAKSVQQLVADGDETEISAAAARMIKPGRRVGHLALRRIGYGEAWWETLLIPVRIFFQGRDNDPAYFDGKLNPLLILLPLLLLLPPRRKENPIFRQETAALCAFAVLFLLIAFFMRDMRIRYVAPIIPPLVILSVFGIGRLSVYASQRFSSGAVFLAKVCFWLPVCAFLVLNLWYLACQFQKVRPFSYLSGSVSREAYIEARRPEYPVIRFANKALGNEDRILGVFMGNRRYYVERAIRMDTQLLFDTVSSATSPDGIAERLKKKGFTHLLIGAALFQKWRHELLDADENDRFDAFAAKHLRLLKAWHGYHLYAVNFR